MPLVKTQNSRLVLIKIVNVWEGSSFVASWNQYASYVSDWIEEGNMPTAYNRWHIERRLENNIKFTYEG